jgi:hypothetical protein
MIGSVADAVAIFFARLNEEIESHTKLSEGAAMIEGILKKPS